MNMELRFQETEIRANEDGTMKVSGYVNLTEQLSNVLGLTKKFKEKIAKGAFAKALKNATKDIDFLSEHDNKKILASTRNGSLELTEDEQGLFMSATIAPTSYGKDSYELIKSGILQNMSFGFRTIKDSWKAIENGLYERTILELELFEVSVVRDPAYSQSTIAARGIDLVEEVEVPSELEEETKIMEELLKKIETLTEMVSEALTKLQELTTKEVETKADEPVEAEAPEESKEGKEVDEPPTEPEENKESKEDTQDESNTDEKEVEDEKEPDKEPEKEEVPDKDSENSEESEDSEDMKDEEKKDSEKRSVDKPDLSEFKNILASLKK